VEVTGQVHTCTAVPAGEEQPVSLEWVTGWASAAVWLLWRRAKPLSPSTD